VPWGQALQPLQALRLPMALLLDAQPIQVLGVPILVTTFPSWTDFPLPGPEFLVPHPSI
jgi:hypothetical protein